jgi:hypothetical protein
MTTKKISPWYIHAMYYYLLAMSDDDLDEFHINDAECQSKLFDAMKTEFEHFGTVSKQRVLEAIEYIHSSSQLETLWGWVIPQAVLLDEIEDKPAYLCALYKKLSGHELTVRDFGPDVELIRSPGSHGIDVRE